MKIRNSLMLSMGFILILGLAGCAHYKAQPLNKLGRDFLLKKEEQFISFAYRIFNKRDCKRYLDRDVISKGYQPVHITFTNNSNRHLNFSITMFSLPCVNSEEVAEKVFTSTTGRAVGYGVGALFIWPLAISAIVDGVGSSQANEKLDVDFHQKTLRDRIVKPFSVINGLIFVPVRDFDPEFSFTIVDPENREEFVLSTTSTKVEIQNQFIKK